MNENKLEQYRRGKSISQGTLIQTIRLATTSPSKTQKLTTPAIKG